MPGNHIDGNDVRSHGMKIKIVELERRSSFPALAGDRNKIKSPAILLTVACLTLSGIFSARKANRDATRIRRGP